MALSWKAYNHTKCCFFSHFKEHFAAQDVIRPGVENLLLKNLSYAEGSGLIKPFSEGGVKAAVWDCDSFKSPSPDGVNFGFIKEFWEDIKGDVMRFISDFHRNGKLTIGINTTFIALIPKVDIALRDYRIFDLLHWLGICIKYCQRCWLIG